MGQASFLKQILWAINPYDETVAVQEHLACILNHLAERTQAQIRPIYVQSSNRSYWNTGANDFRRFVEGDIQSFLKKFPAMNLEPYHIIVKEFTSATEAVQALNHYAMSVDADLIGVGTRGKSGIPRIFLGSFVETLILNATKPLLSVGPRSISQRPIQNVLIPTDLDNISYRVFEEIAHFVQVLKANVTLYHAFPVTSEIASMTLGAQWTPSGAYLNSIENQKRDQARELGHWFRSNQIDPQVVVEPRIGDVANSITSFAAHNGIDLIALAAQSGSVEAKVLGSVTRRLIRSAPCPVWVMRAPVINAGWMARNVPLKKEAPEGASSPTSIHRSLITFRPCAETVAS